MVLIFSRSPLLQKVTRGGGLFSNELTAGNFIFCSASLGFLMVTSNNFQYLPDILSTNYILENIRMLTENDLSFKNLDGGSQNTKLLEASAKDT